jgi:hypothetical protein
VFLGIGMPVAIGGGSNGGSSPQPPPGSILLWSGNNDPNLALWQQNFKSADNTSTLKQFGNDIYLVSSLGESAGSWVFQISVSAAGIDGTLHADTLTAVNSAFAGPFVINVSGNFLRGVTGLQNYGGNNAGGNGTNLNFASNPLTQLEVNTILSDLNSSTSAGPGWGTDSTISITTISGTNPPSDGPPDGADAMANLALDGWTVNADS